jgi:outer membrane lipoprotein-sorting protein
MTRYQVPKDYNPLKLGEGPFPLPFGQETAEVLRLFTVQTRAARDGEPVNSDYLKLTPRDQGPQGETLYVEMWVDRESRLPVKIASRGKDKKTITTAFEKIKTGVKLDDKTFLMEKPPGRWQYEVKLLENAEGIQP